MKIYPPGSLVLVVHPGDGTEVEEVYPFRVYYRATREYGHMRDRCERWGSEEADARTRELGLRCVRAFVPYPVDPDAQKVTIWRRVLALVKEIRALL